MNIHSITIIGRRWFQRSYGNTYHSVEIIVNGEAIRTVPQAYGYGDHYIQTAAEELHAMGLISTPQNPNNGARQPLWQYCRERGIAFEYSVTDVARERDL